MTYDPNSLEPTRDLDIKDGALTITLYGQDGVLNHLRVKDTQMNRYFAVWCRKYDRQ